MGKLIDLTGLRFGRLTVLNKEGKAKHGGSAKWKCRCNCGNVCVVNSRELRNGDTKSCGCYAIEKRKENGRFRAKNFNDFEIVGDITKIYDSNGNFCYIDTEDLQKISNYRWHKDSANYWQSYIKGSENQSILLHRLILSVEDNQFIDHIDHDRSNCTKKNLRICTPQQNAQNLSLRKDNKTGVIGVFYKNNKWTSYINVNKKTIYLGNFSNKKEAIETRLKAELKYFGDFAPQRHLFKQYGIEVDNG